MVNTPIPTCTGPTLAYAYVGAQGGSTETYQVTSNNGNSSLRVRQSGMPGVLSPAPDQTGTSPLSVTHTWEATAADYGHIRAGWVGAQDSQNKLAYCGTFLIAVPNDLFDDGFED
jgi:hypothetical protein